MDVAGGVAMSDLAISLEGIELPMLTNFVGTRDVVRTIVRRIADAFAVENVTVAIEETAGRENPEDTLIVFDGTQTATLALRYSPQLLHVENVPHFIGHDEAVAHVADQIVADIQRVLRRWDD
jgi:hypothetical protein